jgi:bidirectional [NiFe] hydrogenase diaphorase subunit
MAVKTLIIDGKHVGAEETETILDAATDAGIQIPTLCHLEGLSNVGACRMCLGTSWGGVPTRGSSPT